MRVMCIVDYESDLKKGVIYKVIRQDYAHYYVHDNYRVFGYFKNKFKIIRVKHYYNLL
jgi:hypothetical protein